MARRALIVDDDPAVRDILSIILRRDGWAADTAADGEQAIARLAESEYSVIVLDLMMPRIDGAGVIAHIRERGIRTPVIVVSAVARMQVLDPQVVTLSLQKPFELGDLRAVVRAITETAASAQTGG